MFILKFIIFLKNIISRLILLLVSLLSWLFRFLFYKIFLNIYYWLFRLKKYEIKENGKNLVINQKAMPVLAIILMLTISIFSLTSESRAGTDPKRMRNSIMANAVTTEFHQLGTEELMEELADPSALALFNQAMRYLPSTDLGAILPIDDEQVLIMPSDDDNLALVKPKQIDLLAVPEEIADIQETDRTEIIEYLVESGDTVSTIAQNFGLRVNTVLWANNLNAFSLIRPGDTLTILPIDGIVHTVRRGETLGHLAQTYAVASEQISEYNNITDDLISIGQKLIIPGGLRPAPRPTRIAVPTPSHIGVNIIRDLVVRQEPAAGNRMVWPTDGHRITQYFSWRHFGLDIANRTGTPIYTADAGTVEFSGWSVGYGNNIIINHGGGIKTRYAHMSQMFVRVGQEVNIGEHIAAMGSTGWSTGPHLHFEVIINGVRQNPLNFIR